MYNSQQGFANYVSIISNNSFLFFLLSFFYKLKNESKKKFKKIKEMRSACFENF